MKRKLSPLVWALIILVIVSSCFHYSDHDISISIDDDDDEYEMDAHYPRRQTHAVQVYLDEQLLSGHPHMKHNRYVDEEVRLDDNTSFYINSKPGKLHIKIDKTENSEASCERIKQACEDLKEILAKN